MTKGSEKKIKRREYIAKREMRDGEHSRKIVIDEIGKRKV